MKIKLKRTVPFLMKVIRCICKTRVFILRENFILIWAIDAKNKCVNGSLLGLPSNVCVFIANYLQIQLIFKTMKMPKLNVKSIYQRQRPDIVYSVYYILWNAFNI